MDQADYNTHRLRMRATFDMITSGCYATVRGIDDYGASLKRIGGRLFQFKQLGRDVLAAYSRDRSTVKEAFLSRQGLCIADDGYYMRRLMIHIPSTVPMHSIGNNKQFMDYVCDQAPEDSTIEYYSGSWHY